MHACLLFISVLHCIIKAIKNKTQAYTSHLKMTDNRGLQVDSLPKLLAWSEAQQLLDTVLYSSDELSNISHWLCHKDSTTRGVVREGAMPPIID